MIIQQNSAVFYRQQWQRQQRKVMVSSKAQVRRPTRPEHVIAFEFLKIHYEEDVKADTPIQKSDVYTDYEAYCTTNNYKPLVAADFGRILKSMFPNARDRRLGSRGSSKYCYVGVKRKSESNTKSARMNPYSAEDLAKAYQAIVCEWASTVLSRRMTDIGELAKYLLKNRFVQTRSCAALTISASLKDTDELADPIPINKHRETQLKLQEKLREKLFNKQTTVSGGGVGGSVSGGLMASAAAALIDDPELHMAQRIERAISSTSSTPDSEGQHYRQRVAQGYCSGDSSLQTSPEHASAGLSMPGSVCTSPVFSDPIAYRYGSGTGGSDYRPNGFQGANGDSSMNHVHFSQGDGTVGSERSTPVTPVYQRFPAAPHHILYQQQQQYDPRMIQSCPTTPLPSYQQQRFDFCQQTLQGGGGSQSIGSPQQQQQQQQCNSLPNSNRNTPVQDGCYGTVNGPPSNNPSYSSQSSVYQNHFLSNGSAVGLSQRVEFGRNNSAFVPVKEDVMVDGESIYGSSNDNPSLSSMAKAEIIDSQQQQQTNANETDDLVLSELLKIMESSNSQPNSNTRQPPSYGSAMHNDRIRSMSAQPFSCNSASAAVSPAYGYQPGWCVSTNSQQSSVVPAVTTSTSVIHSLLKAKPSTSADRLKLKLRHSSGPPINYGYVPPKAKVNFVPVSQPNSRVIDLSSPPSTPNGNFRPVSTPNRELRQQYAGGSSGGSSGGVEGSGYIPNMHCRATAAANNSSSLVGTMSPPAQPLSKRKRQHSGDTAANKPHITARPVTANSCSNNENSSKPKISHTSPPGIVTGTNGGSSSSSESAEHMAKRNLNQQLASPQQPTNYSQNGMDLSGYSSLASLPSN